MKELLVTGSFAYDRIAVFKDKFSNHILPEKIHQLNVVFTTSDMVLQRGGTAGNIAYNLSLLGGDCQLFGTVGYDGQPYLDFLKRIGGKIDHMKMIDDLLTANCTITTDLADNQITAFCDAALTRASESTFELFKGEALMAIISPTDVKAMLRCMAYCKAKKVPFISDVAQRLPLLKRDELRKLIKGAYIVMANDYEWEVIQQRSQWSEAEILEQVGYAIVTLGDQGSKILSQNNKPVQIRAYQVTKVLDPTGCGDAYRAGLMFGLKQQYSLKKSAHIGSWLASKCVMKKGTQNHVLKKAEFKKFLSTL